MLRPGYKLPNRRQVAGNLLEDVYASIKTKMHQELNGKTVCMSLDGWRNIRNESIICICVTEAEEKVCHLIDTVDTEGNSHTSEYLLQLAIKSIEKCNTFGCKVRSFVTDNAANMGKMRRELSKKIEADIITYGCSAHLLNLFAHDIEETEVKDKVKRVIKYFRNSHYPAAKYKEAGGKALVLPQDVRWNTLSDCLQSYIDNWHILSKVCSEQRCALDADVLRIVQCSDFKIQVEDYQKKLKRISIALDKVQKDDCNLGESVEIWLELKEFLTGCPECSENEFNHYQKRFEMAMTPSHFLANLLHPLYKGERLSENQMEIAMEYVDSLHPAVMPEILKYKAQSSPFQKYRFKKDVIQSLTPQIWWMSFQNSISEDMKLLCNQLFSAVASSAGIERMFSSFGLVHSKMRNKLGNEKAAKLTAIFKHLNRSVSEKHDKS